MISRLKRWLMPRAPRRPSRRRIFSCEALEPRQLLAGLPFGAKADDTAEFMLGSSAVTVVFMESDPTLSPFDASTENWTVQHRAETKLKIADGLRWWQD